MLRTMFAALAALAAANGAALAQNVADFYRNKQLQIIVGYGPGGGYDVYARLVGRHLGKHVPGAPGAVVQNMPGAGSLLSVNFLANTTPRDGSVIGTFARDMALLSLLGGNQNVRFDPRKLTWIGTPSSAGDDAYLMFVRKDARLKKIEESTKQGGGVEIVLGGTGEGAAGNDWAVMLRDAVGLNIRLIAGYRDSSALFLAVERGEIDGRSLDYSAVKSSRPHWLAPDSPVKVVLQFGRETRHPDFPNVPLARDLTRDPQVLALIDLAEVSNTLSRPFAGPPEIPADRARALQDAFMAMCNDPEFRAEAEKLRVDVSPVSGPDVLKLIERLANFPPSVLESMKKIRSQSK
ncbi:MAG: Bug family tripartite tricarboxylate transporter substrate binding protein [Beijerinckiaceae bacterium]